MILDWIMTESLKNIPSSERSGDIQYFNLPKRQRIRRRIKIDTNAACK